jgi:hypothetical protein
MRITVSLLALTLGLVAYATPANLVANGSFEAGAGAWKLGAGVTIEQGEAAAGQAYLRCGCVKPGDASAATLTGLAVKPHTGYVARCKLRFEGGAHYTFGILKPDGTFFVCRDVYGCPTPQWDESVLPFRTEAQTQIGLYVGRRYGASAIQFDAVELVEDDSVRIGDVSPQPNPFPALTSEEQARGFVFAPQPWLKLVYPTTYPTRAEINQKLQCQLAPGETEPMTLAITADQPLRNVRVQLYAPLTDARGRRLPLEGVSLGVVRHMQRWLTNGAPLQPGQRYERRPLLIYPNQPFDVPARETRQVWLTVQAPADQRPGVYEGSLQLAAEGSGLLVPLQVRVLPIALAEAQPTYGMYYRQDEQPKDYQTEAFYRRSMADMRAHGMNSMSLYANVERKQPDGTWQMDFEQDTSRYSLTHQMALLSDAGLASATHPLLFLATGKSDGIFGNQEKLVAAVEELRRARGWPELLFYLVDEPGSAARIALAKELNDIVHRVPGVRTTTALGDPGELADYYDVWITSTSAQNLDAILKLGREKHKEVWAYNCQWNGTQPANDRYFCGYHMWITGLRGNWQWCYTEGFGGSASLKDELPHKLPYYEEPWYVNYVLPTPEGNLPTLGWEARREGVDDYRYLQTLRAAIAAAPKKQRALAQAAERFLADAARRLTPPAQALPATNTGRNYGFVMHPGLGPTDYDALRAQAAEHLIKLQGR